MPMQDQVNDMRACISRIRRNSQRIFITGEIREIVQGIYDTQPAPPLAAAADLLPLIKRKEKGRAVIMHRIIVKELVMIQRYKTRCQRDKVITGYLIAVVVRIF